MDWNDLRVFLIAVRSGSYTAAAARLDMNRTTVGRRVSALESALNATLFREGPFGPEPTREGRLVLEAAARIEAELGELHRALAATAGEPGVIRIASSAGVGVEFLDLFAEFQRLRPHVGLELLGALDPIEAVSQRRADLAIALARSCPRRLSGVRIGPVTQALYARRGAEAARRLTWGREMELALPGQWTAANAATPEAPASGGFNNWPQLKQAVLQGLGAAWLLAFAAETEPDLVRLAPPEPRWETALWLLHRTAAPVHQDVASLIGFLAPALQRRLKAPELSPRP
jgi:DNA-binding transcriptional LysR family regulator